MLKKRVITALWALPLAITAVWFDKPLPWFSVLVAVCGLLAAFEFYSLVTASKVTPLTYFGIVWTLLFIISPHFAVSLPTSLLLTSAVLISLIRLFFLAHKEQAFAGWAWTMGGILYIGWLLGYLVALRGLDDGRNWVFLTLFTTFAYDTMAFFTGRTWGKHQLAPRISPSKTWEGVIGGIIGAIIISLFFILPTPLSLDMNWQQAILLGILVSIFSQLGDLVESLFKRNMGAKDSGRLMPGHGGILDRIDSLIFAGVTVYYYAIWIA
ncbi:MAG: phosphatidate cytidylyltransferase [Chloroflexi bacterium]|nr:phosphatidate cytidylyltransferase [Chloroflexota bacterium]MBI2979951.1 phosphatidate cytidylyltransferase [Chloroflexota bacterium]